MINELTIFAVTLLPMSILLGILEICFAVRRETRKADHTVWKTLLTYGISTIMVGLTGFLIILIRYLT